MEIEGLGARCHLSTCRTLDFLPYVCQYCSNTFCSVHISAPSHSCRSIPSHKPQVTTCPLCSQPVSVPSNTTPDVAVSRHIEAGCPKRKRVNPICDHVGCSKRDVVSTTCPRCRKTFCLQHRNELDHNCVAREAIKGRNPFGQKVDDKKSSGLKLKIGTGKATAVAALKKKTRGTTETSFVNTIDAAIGNKKVDMEDRVTVAVMFPRGSGVRGRYMFFSKRLSAGRILDGLLKDVNGLEIPANSVRLSLYVVKRGGLGVNLLPHITPLRNLPSGTVQDGDFLVVEQGDQGLDEEWIATVKSVAGGRSAGIPGMRGKGSMARKRTKGNSGGEQCVVA